MEINRHNYEAYLLDLLEGSLSVEDQQQLHNFLLLNPDCRGELTEMEPWVLESEKLCFQNSKLLKKELPNPSSELSDHNFDLFSIARMEGDLSGDQIAAHQAMVDADALHAQHWSEWQRTILVPEPLVFKGKDRLIHRKESRNRVLWMSIISAAAAVALLFILFRTGPDPVQESYTQTPQEVLPQEEISQQAIEVPGQADVQTDIQMDEVEPVENLAVQSTPDPPVQKLKEAVLFTIQKDHDRPIELASKVKVAPQEDLKPSVLSIAASQINTTSAASEIVPDQIEPLYLPPESIHMSSMSVAQISDVGLQEIVENYAEEKDFSLLKIASAGIRGISKITGSDISLMASRDDEGEVSGYQLKSKRFSLARPLDQED